MRSTRAIDRAEITGLVLAGGRGARMGGADKGLLPVAGQALVAHVLARLAPQVGRLIVSANRNLAAYRAFGHDVVTDRLDGFAGPLAGLQAGLAAADTPYVLCAPCDTPDLPPDLARRLGDALIAADATLALAATGATLHPVICLMRREVEASLASFLATGQRKVRAWTELHRSVVVDFGAGSAFLNLNSRADLDPLERP